MGTFIIVVVIAALIFFMANEGNKIRKKKEAYELTLAQSGHDTKEETPRLTYVSGHPSLDNSVTNTTFLTKDGYLELYKVEVLVNSQRRLIAKIPIDAIKNIELEDATSIERKVTAGRVLMFGILALAMKKAKTHESAFLTLEWDQDRFTHFTVFSAEGPGSRTKCNTVRNKLVNLISTGSAVQSIPQAI